MASKFTRIGVGFGVVLSLLAAGCEKGGVTDKTGGGVVVLTIRHHRLGTIQTGRAPHREHSSKRSGTFPVDGSKSA